MLCPSWLSLCVRIEPALELVPPLIARDPESLAAELAAVRLGAGVGDQVLQNVPLPLGLFLAKGADPAGHPHTVNNHRLLTHLK